MCQNCQLLSTSTKANIIVPTLTNESLKSGQSEWQDIIENLRQRLSVTTCHQDISQKFTLCTFTQQNWTICFPTRASRSVAQSWTWIGSIHGLDWIGSGFWGNFVDWIGLGPMTAILCFFHLYIFCINDWQTVTLWHHNVYSCRLQSFMTWLWVLPDTTLRLYCFMTSSHLAPAWGPHAVSIRRPLSVCRLNAPIAD